MRESAGDGEDGEDGASEVVGLVRAAAAGDRAAWEELVQRYAPLVMSVTRRHRLPAEDAQDVAQTVWLRLLEHLGALREPAALPGWISVTTRHECLRVLSAARRSTPVDSAVLAERGEATVDSPDAALLHAERHDVLLAAFAGLSQRQRELLLLLATDPPTPYSEITARLAIPVGSIGPTRARALRALRASTAVRAFVGGGDRPPADGRPPADDRRGATRDRTLAASSSGGAHELV